ncbi:hypothetical protein BDZ90DRAFT_258690 [Jaminaea rosea]|uniref:Uncharacterized protein n=1 Tax=Jaminaea rosea TaxID=1569628 RepID=A0A316UWV6_9BASI|nr:hypothetical protein BDZ90DRAFT_258690 [Jaminaea rosea]PWN29786.1 hypothetical protein BDZ90DRAFT_258690 [Jaminaea rosea]
MRTSTSLIAAAILVLASLAQAQLPTPTEGAGFLPQPPSQPSIAGGAGPFGVSSLSRSSSFNFDQAGQVAQTTTYQPPGPSYAATNVADGNYNTNTDTTTIANGQDTARTTLPSLTSSSTATASAVTPNGARGQWSAAAVGPVVAAGIAAVIGAGLVM